VGGVSIPEQDLDLPLERLLDYAGEVLSHLIHGHTAEPVIRPQRDNQHTGVRHQGWLEAAQAASRGIAGDTGIDDAVAVAAGVDTLLQPCGIGFLPPETRAGCQAVAERNDNWRRTAPAGHRHPIRARGARRTSACDQSKDESCRGDV